MEHLTCSICQGSIVESPDNLVLCKYHNGLVHMGCCMYDCSKDGTPCEHAVSIYNKE